MSLAPKYPRRNVSIQIVAIQNILESSNEDLARYAALIFDRDFLTQWYIPKNNGASVRFIKE